MSKDTELELSPMKSVESSLDHDSINSLQLINDKTLDDIEQFTETKYDDLGKDQIDPTISHYIELCQTGDLNTVKEMIESGDVVVGTVDKDGASGLHWAAINNKLAVVKYLAGQGAEIDLRGGELQLTPLQWACRFGLVYIADFLIRDCKLDPTLCDNQGFNSLLLAVHSSNIMLVIYLLNFTDISVNTTDSSNRTPLHWAAYQGDSLTIDTLLDYGADVTAKDETKFTALHWSLLRGNHYVIKNLLEHGSDVNEKNNDNKDCFDIALEMNCLDTLHLSLKENGLRKDGSKINRILSPKNAKIATFIQPYLILFLACKILSLSQEFLIPKFFLTFIILAINHLILIKWIIPCYVQSANPLMKTPYLAGIFSGTSFWAIVVWLVKIMPLTIKTNYILNFMFAISATAVVASFFKAMFINPGFIPRPAKREIIQNTIVELIHLKKFDSKHFCIHTYIRRPLRSKFSWQSKSNVARFDHYCPWVYNEIGVRNHKLFLTFILSLEIAIIAFVYLTNKLFSNISDSEVECLLLSQSFCKGYQQESFLFNLTIWSCFQFLWLTFLVFVQLFQIAKGMTSYEAANVHRHDPNGDTRKLYYASVPSDAIETESVQASNSSTNTIQGSQTPVTTPKVGCIRSFLANSSISKLLGLDLFVMTLKDAIKMKDSISATDYGIKRNLLDFWFIRDDSIDEGYTWKTLMRLPIEGELNLNGQLVDYYKLWQLPSKSYSMV